MRKTLTEKQLQANRTNAQKSTGPKTPRGKRASSQNAVKHGFLAQSILLPGESRKRFFHLRNTYLNQFHPQTQDEHDLVDTLTVNRWRLLRNWTFESASLIHEQRQQADANATEDSPTQGMLARRNLDYPPRSHEALSRHEVRLDRQYYKALDRLRKIAAERRDQETTAAETAPKTQQNKENPQQTHHNQQTKPLIVFKEPLNIPKEPQTKPNEDQPEPTRNPLAA